MLAPPYTAEINSVEFMFGIWKQNIDKMLKKVGLRANYHECHVDSFKQTTPPNHQEPDPLCD